MQKNFLLFLFVLVSFFSSAGMKDAFEALNKYDYFNAKKQFEKVYKKNTSIGAFGLASIFVRNDNPFHSLDSARKYVLISEKTYLEIDERKRDKWAIFGWTTNGIDSLKTLVSEKWFKKANEKHTLSSFNQFLEMNPWSNRVKLATRFRDSIALRSAIQENTSLAFKKFVKNYPKSEFLKIAQDNFYNAEFNELTKGNSESEFANFILKKANSPLRKEAEKKLYEIVTKEKSKQSFLRFIEKYSHTSYTKKAWKHLFELHLMSGYSRENIQKFLSKYRDNPIKDSIRAEIRFVNEILLPFKEKKSFGFMNLDGKTIIPAKFDNVEAFHEGLAIAEKNGKFGAINRTGKIIVPLIHPSLMSFENGFALVENENEKLGLIRRDGEMIFQTEWEDLGTPSEHLIYAENASGEINYYNLSGQKQFDKTFNSASDFKNGKAKIATSKGENFIDVKGKYLLQQFYDEISLWNDTIFIASQDDYFGLIGKSGTVILPFDYDLISPLKKGKAIVVMGSDLAYINKKGEIIIDDDFENFPNVISKGSFKNGYAIAVKNEKYGRIDATGKKVTKFNYQNLEMTENVIVFELNSLWGWMDFSNEIIVKNQYDAIETIGNNYFIVYRNDSVGVVNAQGKVIVPIEYNKIKSLGGHYFAVSHQGIWGIHSHALKTKINYQECQKFNEDLILLIDSDNKISYFQKSSNRLIEHIK